MTAQPVRVGLGEVAQSMRLPLLAHDPRVRVDALSDVFPGLTESPSRRCGAGRRHPSAEALTSDRHVRITYDRPDIRLLPMRLEATASGPGSTVSETVGPFHEDEFRLELDAFHKAVTQGDYPETTLEGSLADLELLAEVGRHFLRQDRPEGADPAGAETTRTSDGGVIPRANQGERK